MSEAAVPVGFYHLTRSSAEDALPRLLGRTLDAGKRALVMVADAARAAELDEALWRAPDPAWLPHGSAGVGAATAHASLQPIWIAPDDAAPNAATYLFLLDSMEVPDLARFERVFDLFDGNDAEQVARARARWTAMKQAGHRLTYWRQEPGGWREAG